MEVCLCTCNSTQLSHSPVACRRECILMRVEGFLTLGSCAALAAALLWDLLTAHAATACEHGCMPNTTDVCIRHMLPHGCCCGGCAANRPQGTASPPGAPTSSPSRHLLWPIRLVVSDDQLPPASCELHRMVYRIQVRRHTVCTHGAAQQHRQPPPPPHRRHPQ